MNTRIKELEEKIKFYRDLYYNGSEEEQEANGISDAEYDLIELELKELDPENELLQEVGSSVAEEGREKLVTAMLSQEKALTEEESRKILSRFRKNEKMVLTEKLDGCGLDVTFVGGKIKSAVTRGTWIEGTQVINQAKLISNLPKEITGCSADEIHVRGEVVIKTEDFIKLNEEQEIRGKEPFSNPRNLAAGTIKIQDLEEVKRRCLYFVAYEIFAGSNLYSMPTNETPSYSRKLALLEELGFTTPVIKKIMVKDVEDIVFEAYKYLEHPEDFPYAIDGIVVKMDDLVEAEEMGETTHHPRCSFAVKPKPEEAWVTVTHVDWTMSRLGTVTPTAVYETVALSGAGLSRVNIHNVNNMAKLNVAKGTRLKIVRSGLVIPRAIGSDMHKETVDITGQSEEAIRLTKENLTDLGYKILNTTESEISYYNPELWRNEIPSNDPSTGEPLVEVELTRGGARILRVADSETNYFTVAKKIEHFLKSVRVLGWGESLLVDFCKNSKVKSLHEFFESILEGSTSKFFTDRTISKQYADKLEKAVTDYLKSPKDPILAIKGFGISHAQSVVEKAVDNFKSDEDVLNPLKWKPYVTPGIYAYIEDDINSRREELRKSLEDIKLQYVVSTAATSSKLAGKSFVITGTLTMPRKQAEKLIKDNGGVFMSAISSKTTYLLCGEGGGSKRAKAEALGVKTISEEEFRKMLQ